ncbi:hypothetical protein [Streptomyces flaveolus]|uniref:hypothetical protein n=1 Tax=Streptomyces flaveolus TaxID=67297 RepID=UPI00331D0A28
MHFAPQAETAAIPDAKLDNVSGGLTPACQPRRRPHGGQRRGCPGQIDAVKNEVLTTVGHYNQAGVSVSL